MRITLLGMTAGISGLLLLQACGGGQPAQDTLNVDQAADSTAQARKQRTKAIFYNIPSPMETAALLKKAGAQYDKDILNDPNKNSSYTAASKQALNLGIYGADLSYASVYSNTHESMLFTAAAQNLAKQLNISSAFSQEVVDRMEKNRDHRDSLLNIISETYWEVDAYLKENQRENISAMMIAGGWVEGLYIATAVCAAHDTPELRQRIAEQKLPLADLIALVSTYSGADQSVAGVLSDLKALDAAFTGVSAAGGGSSVSQEGGVTVIGGAAPAASLTNEQLKAITEKTAAIRNTYIN
jgi:hypothetical protein